jgi:hypothetical protein
MAVMKAGCATPWILPCKYGATIVSSCESCSADEGEMLPVITTREIFEPGPRILTDMLLNGLDKGAPKACEIRPATIFISLLVQSVSCRYLSPFAVDAYILTTQTFASSASGP